jgi:imidazolonepropionase-like amidohydrolase
MTRSLIAGLMLAFIAVPAFAQTPAADLAKPPANAQVVTITSGEGIRHGQVSSWVTKDGTHWSRMSFNLRGFVNEIDQQMRFAKDGAIEKLVVRGFTPSGDAAENYESKNGSYSFKSPVDDGTGKADAKLFYSSFGGTPDSNEPLVEAMLKASDHKIKLLPSGEAKMEQLATLTVANGKGKKTLTAYAITGFGLSPFPVWLEGGHLFGVAGVINFLPEGWESVAHDLSKAQDDALAKRAPALMARIAKKPAGPLAFHNVRIYDADARQFRDGQTVVVDNGRITAVGAAASTKIPAGAQTIEGAGKTLIPGLWDNHQHYSDDDAGPLLLAQGITSVRDPGNLPKESMARKKRIDDGELLGPRIVPSLLIDGKGQYTAQAGVAVGTLDEALAAVHRAKDEGYFGIKLYGSLPKEFVKPMASLAHSLGLRVHGHIPHGMRPLDAVHDGYDEITHINFVMMQAMPDDVVNNSNGMQRFFGPGRYAAGVDLHSKAMQSYLDELARRHIAVDTTLVTFEDLYMPDRGEIPAADAPYADTLPPQLVRGLRAGSVVPPPDLPRETMRKSYAKLEDLAAELNRRHVTVLAGTDGFAFELIRELELYVKAGMSKEDALAAATIVPAQTYKLGDQTGSLKVGKLAELALIDGDPSKNIGDLRQVELVMRDGKLMHAADLRDAIGISGLPKK